MSGHVCGAPIRQQPKHGWRYRNRSIVSGAEKPSGTRRPRYREASDEQGLCPPADATSPKSRSPVWKNWHQSAFNMALSAADNSTLTPILTKNALPKFRHAQGNPRRPVRIARFSEYGENTVTPAIFSPKRMLFARLRPGVGKCLRRANSTTTETWLASPELFHRGGGRPRLDGWYRPTVSHKEIISCPYTLSASLRTKKRRSHLRPIRQLSIRWRIRGIFYSNDSCAFLSSFRGWIATLLMQSGIHQIATALNNSC